MDRFVVVGEDQYPVARVGFEDFFEYAHLGGGAQRDLAVAAIGVHGTPAVGAFGGEHDEVAPAIGGAEADILVLQETLVFVQGGFVLHSFFGYHLNLAALDAVFCEVFARQFANAAFVGHGADERVEQHVAAVGSFGGGG